MERPDQGPRPLTTRLRRLAIEDVGLIARADMEFAGGLTVCSGETGSGKTMLLGALAFALGERASADAVRSGAPRARVTLEIEVDDADRERLEGDGFDLDPGEPAIFTREISAAGKSSARINGRPATGAQLRAHGTHFVDFVGQHEQQRLLSANYQLEIVDRYAGETALALRAAVAKAFARVAELERQLVAEAEDAGRSLAERDFAAFARDEIDAQKLESGEDERLRERRDYLANAERIASALSAAHEALTGGDGAASESLGTAAASVHGIARYDPSLAKLASALAALQSEAGDLALEVERERERSEFDPLELETIGERLDAIERLKRKYGGSIDAVREARERYADIVTRFETRDERRVEIESALDAARELLHAEAERLSAERERAASDLETRVALELHALAMPSARFAATLERLERTGAHGNERIEFGIAPNPGEPVRSLARSASGGELSRVLLALCVVLADRREHTALVFDEIDSGVGGATANAVGERLAALARATQVVCVTHLAQIASHADVHYALRKTSEADSTSIALVPLAGQTPVIEELARMLSGSDSGAALEHARTLLRSARASVPN